MLPTIVRAYEAARSRLGVDPYAGWSAAVYQLRSDWEQGSRPGVGPLRDYLDGVPLEHRSEALQDLIAEHLRFAWQAGQGTGLEPYLSEFGHEFVELASLAVVPANLVEDEFLARYVLPHGDTPSVDEYEQRFLSRADVIALLRRRCLDGGRYVKLQKLGQGAMGEVYEAYDRHLRRLVAVKQPREGVAKSADMLHRFGEEARVTAGLEHPAIVSVHEHYQDDSTPFYVMRLASGQTLGERIGDYHQPLINRTRGEQRLFWNQLVQSFAMVCDAMAYAHARGVLHRDLKPGNIIVGEFGETIILDWGMAKRIPLVASCSSAAVSTPNDCVPARGAATDTCESPANMVVGTPQYMPPEQADGIADTRSDVFGLGAILYEMLAGRPPRAWPEGSRPADWLHQVREARFPPPRRLKRKSPRALEAVCLNALARNPAERYGSAADLAQEMRRYLAGEAVAV